MKEKKYTVDDIQTKKLKKEKIVATTAYDFTMAQLINKSPIDLVLVGDSLGQLVCGKKNTLSVSINQMIYHTQAVEKALDKAFLVTDLPFLSYSISLSNSLKNISKIMKHTETQAIKLEGISKRHLKLISVLKENGIPVMGHIGYTPQSYHQFGRKIKFKMNLEKEKFVDEALKLESAGIFSIVLEMIPQDIAESISKKLNIPTIGIGSGPYCDGQILVSYDLLGMNTEFNASFIRKFGNLGEQIMDNFKNYSKAIKELKFPNSKESF